MLSQSMPTASLAASAVIVLAAIVFRYLLSTRRPKDFPPGPPTILGIGNLHQIPLKQPFRKFHEWSKTYGDIIGLKVGPANVVILHSPEYVRELFENRGAIYSGRPYSYIPSEHVYGEHGDKHILNVQNGLFLRRWRAAVSYLVGPVGLKRSLRIQEVTAATLVYRLLDTKNYQDSLDQIKHWALSTPLLAITGQRLEDRGQAFSDRFFEAQHKWLELLEPGNSPPVDFFPFLRWVPEAFAGWKTKARYVREYMLDEYFSYLDTAKKLQADRESHLASQASPSLMTKILEDGDGDKNGGKAFTDAEVAYLGGGLLDAAIDTTWATLMNAIMLLAAHPEIQQRAFEEVSKVCPARAPSADDMERLPYIRACMLETFRLRPPAPNGLPHVLDRDDTFNGYKIPKGTTVLANVWGIQRNEEEYNDPEAFQPERYILHPLGLRPGIEASPGRKATYTFGAGRRICPGEQFAENSVILMLSKLLWAYQIVAPEQLNIAVEIGFTTGLVLAPKPFNVKFVLRDEAKRQPIIADYNNSVLSETAPELHDTR
ncbi:hypothetical protein jhhlp_004869 [Lomentospora prolificans]|uniref:Cytochrome P450 n=1 Tax=Lomentospora prolificans TaxID=41688 RepID=A0A2N3N7R5_9PEZI|nr:hypothetical protein jhhlp_004869 [Lomentospora prolificans]